MNGVVDWLRVLELEPGVSFEDIRRAHRDMAKVWHPDRFPNDERLRDKAEEHQKAINEAFGNLEKWVKSGQALPNPPESDPPGTSLDPYVPGGQPAGVSSNSYVPAGGQPPVYKRHPLRDTWSTRTPLGLRQGYKGKSRRRSKPKKRRWLVAAVLLVGVVTALVVGLAW